jgi:hypothetical protein
MAWTDFPVTRPPCALSPLSSFPRWGAITIYPSSGHGAVVKKTTARLNLEGPWLDPQPPSARLRLRRQLLVNSQRRDARRTIFFHPLLAWTTIFSEIDWDSPSSCLPLAHRSTLSAFRQRCLPTVLPRKARLRNRHLCTRNSGENDFFLILEPANSNGDVSPFVLHMLVLDTVWVPWSVRLTCASSWSRRAVQQEHSCQSYLFGVRAKTTASGYTASLPCAFLPALP